MRLLVLLLVLAGAEDLTPREGSGWAGFPEGAWVRIKTTHVQAGRMLAPTIAKFTLSKVEERKLTLSIKAENALGAAPAVQTVTVPVSGEAGPGEEEKAGERGQEEVPVGVKPIVCDREQVTVTGPAGKRVITKWIARDPKALVKRVTVTYGADGKEMSRETIRLQSLAPETRDLGGRKVRCVKYATERQEAGCQYKGTAYLSRDVPGSLVWSENEISKDGNVVLTQRIEVLESGK